MSEEKLLPCQYCKDYLCPFCGQTMEGSCTPDTLLAEAMWTLERLKFFINSRGVMGSRIIYYTKEIDAIIDKYEQRGKS